MCNSWGVCCGFCLTALSRIPAALGGLVPMWTKPSLQSQFHLDLLGSILTRATISVAIFPVCAAAPNLLEWCQIDASASFASNGADKGWWFNPWLSYWPKRSLDPVWAQRWDPPRPKLTGHLWSRPDWGSEASTSCCLGKLFIPHIVLLFRQRVMSAGCFTAQLVCHQRMKPNWFERQQGRIEPTHLYSIFYMNRIIKEFFLSAEQNWIDYSPR